MTSAISTLAAPVSYDQAIASQARLVTCLEDLGQHYAGKNIGFDNKGQYALFFCYRPGEDVSLIPETFDGLTVIKEVLG